VENPQLREKQHKLIRALLNDNCGMFSEEMLDLFLNEASMRVPYIAAAMIAGSRRAKDLEKSLLGCCACLIVEDSEEEESTAT
jgi:predicted molibdopterin-dependent oxidoreductase YjgC